MIKKHRVMKRTNIEVDEEMLQEALKLTKTKTKREVVNLALKNLIDSEKRLNMLKFKGRPTWADKGLKSPCSIISPWLGPSFEFAIRQYQYRVGPAYSAAGLRRYLMSF